MSFWATTKAVEDRQKDVTRRLGWPRIKAGDILQAVQKARGVRVRDRKVLALIRIKDVREEPLEAITPEDVKREGFGHMAETEAAAEWFIGFFIQLNHTKRRPVTRHTLVRRIEFEYLTPLPGATVYVPMITRARIGPARVDAIHQNARFALCHRKSQWGRGESRWYDVRDLADYATRRPPPKPRKKPEPEAVVTP